MSEVFHCKECGHHVNVSAGEAVGYCPICDKEVLCVEQTSLEKQIDMKIIEYLQMVKNIPEWDRVPAISDKELDVMLNISPWNDPASECFGCKKHSIFDCEKCVR